ncbi:uncharacterized protein B0T15DRAFT_261022 [Chaetomium strumarium]|uniref:Uncharacterized protein n=1 Tax=Chaetomium strumarium TaxID=1170767 RepID=A0AAJ0GN14_9PEZI|nr:hypothetical protein B0T15DRAFT_261022 [Chaetomium strumarium]
MTALQRAIAQNARQAEEDDDNAVQRLARARQRQMREEKLRWVEEEDKMARRAEHKARITIPVIVTPDGPISAEDLQQLGGMDAVPETLKATLIREHAERPVTICYVSGEEMERPEENANIKYYMDQSLLRI